MQQQTPGRARTLRGRSDPQARPPNGPSNTFGCLNSNASRIESEQGQRAAVRRPAAKTKDTGQSARRVCRSAQAKLVDTTLVAAREALTARDLDQADEQLDLALLDASTDSLRARVEGVKTLRHFVGGFWNAIHEHLQKIAEGTELDVEGEIMIVVEVNRQDDILSVRRRGASVDYTKQQMPTNLAVVLAEQWLAKDDENSPVFVGTFLATSAKPEDVKRPSPAHGGQSSRLRSSRRSLDAA